jgi:hypothetical protein
MGEKLRNELWEELKILQTILDKFDGFTFQIKNWFLAIFSAVTGYAVVNNNITLFLLNLGIIIVFYSYEITYRVRHASFLERSCEIQKLLRENENMTNGSKAPHLDKYFWTNLEKISSKTLPYRLQRKMHIEEKRVNKNILEYQLFVRELKSCMFQLRVSLPYWAALVIDIVVLCLVWSGVKLGHC